MLTSKQYHDLLKAKLRRFSRSQEEWKRFLETSSRMYKYGFKESVSIFAQKPNATACAEIKTWKKATNRRVIRTSEAIGLVYSTDNVNVTSIRYVFDIANTVKMNEQSKTPYFWQIDNTSEERVYNELKQAYGVTDAINLEEAIKKIVRERIAYLTKDVQSNIIKSVEGSAAEELDEFALSAVCERFAGESATYAILHRCGIEYDADFSDIYNFDTVNAITAVGDIINQTSEEVLRSIEKTMKAILKEEYYERIRETARNDNESDRRRGDNIQIRQGNGNISSVLGYEGGEDRHRQVRQDEAEISQRAETDTDDVQSADDKRRAGAASADSERAVYQQSVGIRGEEQGEVRSDGRIAEQQSARMDENLQFAENDGRGTGTQRDSLRITEQETAVSSENDTVVSLSEENEITETLTGEEIQIILRYDRFLKHSKSEIAGFFLSDSNEINRAEYLKSAYDEAYTEIMVGDQRYGYHNDIHGLELWKGPSYLSMTANMHISWDCAADIVNDMINSHEYLSADELDKQADYVDIEPQKEENGEQLTFFEMNLPAVTESSVLPVENIKSEHFDNLLRLGSIKNRTPKESKEPHTDYTEYIGKEFEYENRKYKIDSINEGTVSAQDMTMLETSRYPIFRVLDTETVLGIIREQPSEKEKTLSDYTLSSDDYSDLGGEKSRFRHNVEAIKTLKAIESENRNATPDEQKVLAKYVGWGGLSSAFNESNNAWADEHKEISDLLTPDEYAMARENTMTAFYTSPEIIGAVYDGLKSIGFDGGNILDPSAGTGNFFGAMPSEMREKSKLYGVELDSVSAKIAKQLYQSANITEGAYEKRVLNDNFYDAAISNVPFGQFKVHDKRYDSLNLNIHDYFFAKSLDKVRPGGVIAFITTSGTLDKSNSKFRKYMAERAELLGAVRLPNTAFKSVAGTEVTSDIIFLQKRDKIQSVNSENCEWLDLSTDENGIPMNSYFVNHPDMIIGEMKQGIEYSMYGDATATACVAPEGYDIVSHLHNAVTRIDGEYHPYTPQQDEIKYGELKKETIPADESVDNYTYTLYNGNVYYRENSIMTKVDKGADRIAAMIDLKTITRSLLQQQLLGYEQSDIDNTRKELNEHYDAFVKKYGYINSKANETAFSADSSYYLLRSLEKFDKTDNTYNGKADIFIKNTVRPVKTVVSVSTAVESIGVSLCEKGCIDIPYMASLCGLSEEQTIKDCIDAGAIYKVPPFPPRPDKIDIYVTADEYLSGNIRDKLSFARTAALTSEEYQHNVEALEKVMPKPLTASEIDIRIGVTWLDTKYYDDFIRDTFDAYGSWRMKIKTYYSPVTGEFNVSNKSSEPSNVKVNNEFGTSRMNALQIFEHTLNQRTVKVYDRVVDVDGKVKSVLNSKETEKAQEKQELIKEAFSNWIYRDPERRQNIVDKYNELFNSIRPRTFDGSHLVLHGASEKYKLFDHQRNALARTLYGGNTLLAHVVGAGKTFEMVASAMESKYIGVCHKSLICVPNHIVGQIASDFMELYPGANILVATEKDFEMKNRKLLCSKIATGDYDAVIIGHSQLLKIPLSYERQKEYIREDIRQLENALQDMKGGYLDDGQKYSVKQLEKTKKNYETRLEKLTDNEVDDVVTFEELGVDRIYIDEAHMFKNLYMPTKMSNVAGIQMTEAKKSSDLYYKSKYLDEITGGKGVVFATGTPVSNSMTELYTMMRYLQAGTLQRLGLQHFDAWAANYADITNTMELAPEGNTYRMRTRFARFHNLPELMTIFKECADIKTADDLELNVPEAVFENIAAEPSDMQKELMKGLSERATRIHNKMVDATEDNMLKVTSDGRKIGLDQRLMNPLLPDEDNSKVNLCVDKVYDIWQNTAEDRLTQLIFCDFSTPKNDGSFNLYDDVRDKLIAKGVPENEIAYIHDYNTDVKKQTLFAKIRKGDVRVLLGSTAKCGAGTNVQDKLIALHHLDCPWRPADLEQREGRIIRQGNQNDKVYIYRYVTKDTFDAYLYQIIENKQKGISQIMTSKTPVRNCEDVDEAVLNYSEVKALCTGNPLIKERMELDIDISKLKRLQSAYLSEKYSLEDKLLKIYPQRKADAEKYIANTAIDAESYKQYSEEFTEITINGVTFTDKKDAANALLHTIRTVGSTDLPKIGTYKGYDLKVSFDGAYGVYYVTMVGKARYTWQVGQDPLGNLTRMENTLKSIGNVHEKAMHDLEVINRDIATANEFVHTPWTREKELSEKSARLREVDRLIAEAEKNGQQDEQNVDSEEEQEM